MNNQDPEEMTCTLSGVQIQRIRGALAQAVTLLEGLYFTTLTDQQKRSLAIALDTADYIRQVLTEVEGATADIPRGEHEGEFGNE
jgi:hypothetical protein